MSLLDILDKSFVAEDCNYYLDSKMYANSSINMAFNKTNIFTFSNDWLYLILVYYTQNVGIYSEILSLWEEKKNKVPDVIISGKSVLVSSAFSSGTVHGYVGIYEILAKIKQENIEYDNYLVHENSQDGIKHIIATAFPNGHIIYIEAGLIYNIHNLRLIEIKHHNYHYCDEIDYIETNITPLIRDLFLNKAETANISRLAVIKTETGQNLTSDGVFKIDDVLDMCKTRNIEYVDPKFITESQYFNKIYAAEKILFSWGTTHYKGLLYISDKCKKIIIIVKDNFILQYNTLLNHNQLVYKYRNAEIKYVMILEPKDLFTVAI